MAENAEKPEQPEEQPSADAQAEKTAGRKGSPLDALRGLLTSLASARGLALLLMVSLVVHGFTFAYFKLSGSEPRGTSREIKLGEFRFQPGQSQSGAIAGAEFSLYITLLDGFEQRGRQQLAANRNRVQQDIEQLLRQAHPGDFEDPCLTELKRRIQAQINKSLGVRAVADVIITGLELELNREAARPEAQAAQAPAWLDDSAG